MVFEDRILVNPRLLRLKNPETGEVIDFEIQDLEEDEIVQEGTEINAQVMNEMQSGITELRAITLYRNSTGTNETVNLTDDVTNYEHIEIFFRVGQTQKSVKWEKHSTRPYCLLDFYDFDDGYLKFYTKTVQLNGTTITNTRYKKYTIQDTSTWIPYGSDDNEIFIIAVIGYKY